MSDPLTRRDLLLGLGAGAATATAGCAERFSQAGDDGDGQTRASAEPPPQAEGSAFTDVYREAIDSVALLQIYGGPSGQGGQGSAWVYDEDHLVTNHHVVDGAETIDVQYADNDWTGADVVATDAHTDLGVVRVQDRPQYATPLSLSTETPVVGQEVMALGNPLGFDSSASHGIVTGVDRTLQAPTGFSIPNAIQTDASVNPGNSGGPLLNLDAEVIAVINSGGGDNLGFGISAAMVERVVPELLEDGEYEHSYVGIRTQPVDRRVAIANDLEEVRGVMVVEVVEGGPAEGALQGADGSETVGPRTVHTGGDVIVALDDTPVPTRDDLSSYLALETDPGDTITVTVVRDGTEQDVQVTLGRRPD